MRGYSLLRGHHCCQCTCTDQLLPVRDDENKSYRDWKGISLVQSWRNTNSECKCSYLAQEEWKKYLQKIVWNVFIEGQSHYIGTKSGKRSSGGFLGLEHIKGKPEEREKCQMSHVKKNTGVEAGAKSDGSKKASNINDVVIWFFTWRATLTGTLVGTLRQLW